LATELNPSSVQHERRVFDPANRAFRTGRSPGPDATSSTDDRQLARHRYFGNLSSAAHRKVEESTAPHNRLPMAANYPADQDLLVQTFWEANL